VTRLEQLRHAIGVLAASPEDQLLYLTQIGHADNSRPMDESTNIDELALQFEDATYLVRGLVLSGELNDKAEESLANLNNLILRLSGAKNSEFWTIRALEEDSRWGEVRALARECLSEIAH
jgi:hypothetical protein